MRHVDARHLAEQRTGQMLRAAVAGRCVIDLPGMCLGKRDQVFHRFRRQ